MNRVELINKLCGRFENARYLEIGYGAGRTFKQITASHKVGVDPDARGGAPPTFLGDSDKFFVENHEVFDVIFLDGLHLREQFTKDVEHSLECINPKGYIVCPDLNPISERHQLRRQATKAWNGDVWKSWVTLRAIRRDLDMMVLDCDQGLGILKRGEQELLDLRVPLNWGNFVNHHEHWLNLRPAGSMV